MILCTVARFVHFDQLMELNLLSISSRHTVLIQSSAICVAFLRALVCLNQEVPLTHFEATATETSQLAA